uniref:SAM domain-containing protein n=1 Tax=Schizaphis graminum TaxID=13262 RepID=A0A2S2P2B0_SCHGA
MDDFTKNILAEWGFEDYIEKFKNEEIGHLQFMTLTESMIGRLIPKTDRGSIFLSKFIDFKENQVMNKKSLLFEKDDGTLLLVESNPIIDESILASYTSPKIITVIDPEKYVEYILKKSQNGLKILELKGILEEEFKNVLVKELIKHELLADTNYEITKHKFLLLAEGIKKIFPEESKDTYYKKYCRIEGNYRPKGKLYVKYQNLKSDIKKIGSSATITRVNDDGNNVIDVLDTLTDGLNNSSLN